MLYQMQSLGKNFVHIALGQIELGRSGILQELRDDGVQPGRFSDCDIHQPTIGFVGRRFLPQHLHGPGQGSQWIPDLMRHARRHLTKIGQPFFSAHFFFHVSDLSQILEHADQPVLLSLLMQGRDRHAEYETTPIRTFAFHLESGHGRQHTTLRVIGRLIGVPIEDLAPGTTEDLPDVVPRHFLCRGIERGDGASCIGGEYPAADASNDIFVKSLEPGEPLFFLTQRLISLMQLIRQCSAQQPDHENRQGIDAESLKRRGRSQMIDLQPPPVLESIRRTARSSPHQTR